MITFTIDTLTPCLTETSTGEIFETEVIRLKRKMINIKIPLKREEARCTFATPGMYYEKVFVLF